MTYRCRFTAPRPSDWADVAADSPVDAAQSFHLEAPPEKSVVFPTDVGRRVLFARIEVEGSGEMFSRIYCSGLVRKGGVQRRVRETTIQDVAHLLGWEKDPADLLDSGWDGEESEHR